ncbi:MAG: aspartate aminotransferase family protein [Acidobacteria bacterium]|nr:aspartate aminotransferase family protein [Acidobacteriota bacterium]
MTREEIIRKHREYLFPCVATYYKEPLPLVMGKGHYLYDTEGREYLDFFGGIVTISVGHCNPEVTRKINEQVEKLQHVSTLFPTEPIVALAERIAQIAPLGLKKSFFTNSGTEANETAILLAKAYTGRQEIIALRHAYSGRSIMAMALTAHSTWKQGMAITPGVVHAHNAYCYRCPFGLTYPSCEIACARDMEELIQTSTTGQVAGFIAEPIQGVGGFITPPKEYFQITVDIVRKHGGIFISDEVQTGFGRTGGKWWGIEQYGIEPDVITCAKGMANGHPIGATVARPEIADSMKGLTISTFGGNPVTATAAKAVIDFIEEEHLKDNAAQVGAYLRDRLEALKEKYPLIGDVRGMGLMQALELVKDRTTKEPARDELASLMERTREQQLIIGKGGLYGNVVRLSPPLTISRSDVDEAIRRLDAAFAAL